MTDTWKVKVIDAESGDVVKMFEAATERAANRLDDGLNINLNHSEFYTLIEPPKVSA